MKKFLLLVAFAVFGLTAVQAQDYNFGIKAGLNVSNWGGDTDDFGQDLESRTSFHVGVVYEYVISDKFSLQPEVIYSQQGVTFESTFQDFGGEFKSEGKFKTSYLNVPIIAKIYVIEGLSLQVGPQLGFLIDAEDEAELSGPDFSDSDTRDASDDYESFDFSGAFGIGYKLEMGLFLDARYTLGFTNILEGAPDDFSVTNNVLQISVGYIF
ncbi:porin family protein [Gangjinia marincola]|uniref:Porin family protein n=1 Tax=Gangjinia marincola TaxID=578463 RepID=A0ABP3XVD0_9FLAO